MQSHGRRDSFIADFRRDIVRDATPGFISVITAIRLSLPSDRTRGGQQQNGLTRRGGDKCGGGAGSRRSSLTTCQRRCRCRCRCHQEDHQRCARRSRVTRIKALSILATKFRDDEAATAARLAADNSASHVQFTPPAGHDKTVLSVSCQAV